MASPVYVCFWFDTEDYVTPQSDDAAKRLAGIFTKLNAKATFKIVGLKAERLRERERQDVIEAVGRHDIGFHTTSHSRHPTVTEYCELLGWEEGVAAFRERETYAWDYVRRTFRKPISTYGQPGGSWAPQVFPVLREWGVPTYVDEGGHIGLNDEPFWYQGVLNVFRMGSNFTRMNLREPEGLAEGKARFTKVYERLAGSGGGLISICYHPCEWVTEEFWDGVNFARGQNPPLEELRVPQLTAPDEVERRFRDFQAYLKHVLATGAQTVTCAELACLYQDGTQGCYVSLEELLDATADWQDEVGPVRVNAGWLSAAELFALIGEDRRLLYAWARTGLGKLPAWDPQEEADALQQPRHIQGPLRRAARLTEPVSVSLVSLALAEPRSPLASPDGLRVPSAVLVQGHAVGPEDWLAAMIRTFHGVRRDGRTPETVEVRPAKLLSEGYVGDQGLWGWVIFPEGFEAPNCMELARLQAWTLKPAVRAS